MSARNNAGCWSHWILAMCSLAFCVVAFDVTAQPTWKRVFGGVDVDRAKKVIITTDDNYLLLASTGSFGQGTTDAYLLKLDANGDRLWSSLLGTAGVEEPRDVIRIGQDGYLVVGTSYSSPENGYQALLLHVGAQGEQLRRSEFGGEGWDFLHSIASHPSGGGIAVGVSYSWSPIGQGWLISLDEMGDTLWTRTYGSTQSTQFNSVKCLPNGNMLVGGSENGIGGDKNALVAMLNSQGDVLWWSTYGGEEDDEARDIIALTDGGISAFGVTESFSDVTEAYHFKLDAEGELLWERSWGQTNAQEGNEHIELNDGRFASIGVVSQGGAGGKDMFLMILTPDGQFVLGQTQGGGGDDVGYSLVRAEGGYVLFGTTGSYGPGMDDLFVIRTNEVGFTASDDVIVEFDPVSVSDHGTDLSRVFPNPCTNWINIGSSPSMRSMSILDLSGRTILLRTIAPNEAHVSFDLPDGLYLMTIDGQKPTTVVVQRQ